MSEMQEARTGSRRQYKGRYSQEILNLAFSKVKSGELSTRAAAKAYGIPKSTLQDKVQGVRPLTAKSGPDPVLTKTEELKLVTWIKQMTKIKYGRIRQELVLAVKKILDEDGRENTFPNNTPGRQWIRNFMRRNPGLTLEIPERVLKGRRAAITVEEISNWFYECQKFMLEKRVAESFADPARIFNADEIGFPLIGQADCIMAPKIAGNPYQQTSSTKHQITVIGAGNALGQFIPPLIIFPDSSFGFNPLRGAPEHSAFAKSLSGWNNSDIFFEYISNHFCPYVKSLEVSFPIILFVDDHTSYISPETSTFCADEDIVLFCLPNHTSHLIHPLNVSVYKSIKTAWAEEHPDEGVNKQSFASVFAAAWKEGANAEIAIKGFQKCGLYPFDPKAIDSEELIQDSSYRIPTSPEASETSMTMPSESIPPWEAAKAALGALESAMGDTLVVTYKRRLDEAYECTDEPLYETWKKLRKTASPPSSPSLGQYPDSSTSANVSPALEQNHIFPQRQILAGEKTLNPSNVISVSVFPEYIDKAQTKEEAEEKKTDLNEH
ncbi:uncharacterized protein LOC117103674 isoform X1 [Anneissia japonica]|uniref:uncharacterized protein LOC117103674 isoform X1 n=1 Tax=Anneissia japonica TaxID=1529436 RepID=UPI0014254B0B|nr:uncharacterized protein LOC117103674 isoform X1 [Anneissia japonica]